ncbi:hypothetical protein [Bacteriovorax sp. Seq25_V]|uniref:hypothetical protein n=1 Tax=Bacteriovorax sp. Seq25_V TaxID=1201288 RepID=UPI00038A42A1|nr:hypothetical protein [Bacteriovorax sp. Seq25_V]EQC47295.1 hypothetical protein M900_0842 [Bacteriovorax sp. Seq25_V]
MIFKKFLITIFFVQALFAQVMSSEEFIMKLQETNKLGVFDSASIEVFKNTCSSIDSTIPANDELKFFCDVVTKSEVCQTQKKEDLLNCSNFEESKEFDVIDFLAGCTTGLFNSAKELLSFIWDAMKWVWEKGTNPGKSYQEASEYVDSVKLYLVTEYDKAYDKESSPFRSAKAAKAVGGAIAKMLYKGIQEYLYKEYQEFGCLNFQARSEVVCKVAGDFIIPPAAAFAFLKMGPKAFKASDKVKDLLDKRKAVDRKKLSESSLDKKLSDKEHEAIEKAHMVGAGELGADGSLAKVGNYSLAQLKEKAKILKEAGFSPSEVRKLMEDGIVGLGADDLKKLFSGADRKRLDLTGDKSVDEFRDAYNRGDLSGDEKFISFVDDSGNRIAGKVTGSKQGELLVETFEGKRVAVGGENLKSVRTSGTSREAFLKKDFEVVDGYHPGIDSRPIDKDLNFLQEVNIPRSNGGFSKGQVLGMEPNGKIRVQFMDGDKTFYKAVDKEKLGYSKAPKPKSSGLALTGNGRVDIFRDAFNKGNISGDAKYVSVMHEGQRLPAKVSDLRRDGLFLDVRGTDGQFFKKQITDREGLEGIRTSGTAKEVFSDAMSRPPAQVMKNDFKLEVQMSNGKNYPVEVAKQLPDGNVQVNIFKNGQFHSSAVISPSQLKPRAIAPQYFNVKSFIDEFEAGLPQTFYGHPHPEARKGFTFHNGQNVNFNHRDIDINLAREKGKIFDNVRPSELPPGKYTYVIAADGSVSFGRVDDALEFGVKHLHIAQGRKIAVAGEVDILPNGGAVYNELSGTFTMQSYAEAGHYLGDSYQKLYLDKMVGLANRFFTSDPNLKGVARTEKAVFPTAKPNKQDMLDMCNFLRANDIVRYRELHSTMVCN